MKKNEIITLLVGLIVVVFFGWLGRSSFSALFISNNPSMKQESKLPQVSGKNISTDPKLQIIEVSAGTGDEVSVGSRVYVNYVGMLENGTKFDSSYDRGTPIDFSVGTGQVIKGWDLGLLGMKVGGKRRLVIAPEYAYGSAGVGGVIPSNATLVFDLELVNVK